MYQVLKMQIATRSLCLLDKASFFFCVIGILNQNDFMLYDKIYFEYRLDIWMRLYDTARNANGSILISLTALFACVAMPWGLRKDVEEIFPSSLIKIHFSTNIAHN